MSPPAERLVAGMTCGEVLAVLSDFLDGELSAAARENVLQHLRGCNWCEQFGGRFREVVESLRHELQDPEPLPAAVAARLRDVLGRKE